MDAITFASERGTRLEAADTELEPFVRAMLTRWGDDNFDADLLEAAGVLWLELYAAEAPSADSTKHLAAFQEALHSSLLETTEPEAPPEESQVMLVTRWISTYSANDATWRGTMARGGRFTRWNTAGDASVRETHAAADGQVRPVGGTFDIGGFDLHYPGEPVGPPEIWINCRCLIQSAARTGDAMSGTTIMIGPEDELEENPDVVLGSEAFAAVDPADIAVEPADEEDLIEDVPEDGEELITEIPVHGVLAPEGVATGDGRKFALGALSVRDLPLPLRYEVIGSHGGSTSDVVTVGRIDNAWRDDATDSWRYTGAIVLNKPHAQEVIDGLVDGTIRGVSIDGDAAEVEVQEYESEEDALIGLLNPGETVFSKMRVAGATIVPIPAFMESYTALGHEFQEDLSDEELVVQAAALQACGCATGEYREFPPEQREKDADSGAAMPDGSYPIENCDDLKNAIQAIGRAKDPDATKAHIRKRAAALSCPDVELPDAWGLTPLGEQLLSVAGTDVGVVSLDSFAPGTKDGPGWITHPVPTARIRRYWTKGKGAAKIGWGAPGDFNRCRTQLAKYVQNPDWLAGLCANMHKEALGIWPAQHAGKMSAAVIAAAGAPIARLVEPADQVYPSAWFANPGLDRAVPLRVDLETRRVYGYVAAWGTCHVGMAGMCQDVPKSLSDYAYFRKGIIDTDEGEQPVGCLTFGGHASAQSRLAAASDYYDKPDAVRAFVNVGEDEFGIWFAGIVPDEVTEADMRKMRAIGAVSGDWREIRGNLELIGVPVVNSPGFPIRALAASAGKQVSLIGAGALKPEPVQTFSVNVGLDADLVAGIARTAVAEYRHQERVQQRLEPLRAKTRQRRIEAARARTNRRM
jgi:hypothetical protein